VSDRHYDSTPRSQRWDRFHDALDRAAAGEPAPVQADADLQELLELASRLRVELPRDLPDPAFRADLKQRLVALAPGIASLPERRAARRQRVPNVALFGALAAVFLAAIAVGTLAVLNGDSASTDPPADAPGVARSATETATLAMLASATMTLEPAPTGMGGPTTTQLDETPETTPDPPTPSPVAETPQPNNTPVAPGETATAPGATEAPTAVPSPAPTATPTEDRQLAALPPVDSTTVESGPVPLADGGAGGTTAEITFTLAMAIPEIPPAAAVYVLTPPAEAPEAFVGRIGESLGLGADVEQSEDGRGKPDYHVGRDGGASFHWNPQIGAFSYTAPEREPSNARSASDIVAGCRAWLRGLGYPVELLEAEASTQQLSETEWLVEIEMADVPQPGFGHFLGVRFITASDGEVRSATGYWLTPVSRTDVPLISADDAWTALTSGKGYWFGAGGAFMEGGELRCQALQVSHVLTGGKDGMVLQPVVEWRGEFIHADRMSSSGVTVFIQAAREHQGYSGP
jgi:hypothetical protein